MIIAVDGPAASGKGTISRRLAEKYNLAHLDTGLLYRAVGVKVASGGKDVADEDAAEAVALTLTEHDLEAPNLRSEDAGRLASVVAAHGAVRRALVRFQRDFAENPSSGITGAVLDGRDIGTVVCPDADVKLFVTASVEARVKRRVAELLVAGDEVLESKIRADIEARDDRDTSRAISPLQKAEDAHLLDTTNLDIEAAVDAAIAVIDAHRANG